MWCVIPAAGAGTRMGDRGDDRPKPLLRVDGGTLLGRILRDVSGAVEGACLVVSPEDRRLRRALGNRFEGLPLRYVVQEDRRGVGDAVCAASSAVEGSFALVMADGYFSQPLAPYLVEWRESGHPGGLLVQEIESAPVQPAGLARVEGETVRDVAKGTDPTGFTHRICGVTMFPAAAFDVCPQLEPSPATGEVEGEALVRALLDRGMDFGAFVYEGWRRNVNTPRDLRQVRLRAGRG